MRVLWLGEWDTEDLTYTVRPLAIYSILEPALGIVNACLPTIKPALTIIAGPSGLNWIGTSGSRVIVPMMDWERRNRDGKGALTREFEELDDDLSLRAV